MKISYDENCWHIENGCIVAVGSRLEDALSIALSEDDALSDLEIFTEIELSHEEKCIVENA